MKITDEDHHGITAIAIGGDMNSLSAVKWAVDNLVNGNNPHCILVHVQSKTLRLGMDFFFPNHLILSNY